MNAGVDIDHLLAPRDAGAQRFILPLDVGKAVSFIERTAPAATRRGSGGLLSADNMGAGGLREEGANRIGALAHRRHTFCMRPRISRLAPLTDSSARS